MNPDEIKQAVAAAWTLILRDVERIRTETTAEYAEKHYVKPRVFVFSHATVPVRIDPDFSLPVDHSNAEFVRAIKQTIKRLEATAILSVGEAWLTRLETVSPAKRQQPAVFEAVVAALYLGSTSKNTIWIAPIERVESKQPLLKDWTVSDRCWDPSTLFNFLSGALL